MFGEENLGRTLGEQMDKKNVVCSSAILGREMHVNVYGKKGLPVVVFPTLGAAPESVEEAGVIDELADYLDGAIQLFVANGLSWPDGLDWARKLLLLVGALMLITGGCGLFVSGRDRPDGTVTPHQDDTFRAFWHEVGMPWGAAVSVAAVSFLVLGTLVDLLYLLLTR